MSPALPPLRSVLYLPAANARAIEKARGLPADAVVFDLEDAVAPAAKPQARRQLEEAFRGGPVARGLNVVRTNAQGTPDFDEDLATLRRCRPDAVLVPKVSDAEQVAAIRHALAQAFGPETPPALWCMVETARGVLQAPQIAAARYGGHRAVEVLVIGTNDIARETGVASDGRRELLLPWLMGVVLAAKAHGLAVLDGVYNDFKDLAGFEAEAVQGRRIGLDGKTLIHPSQVEAANRVFAPEAAAVAEARAIVAAFAEPGRAGQGVINLGGRMVERLHLEMAQQLLRRQAAIEGRGGAG